MINERRVMGFLGQDPKIIYHPTTGNPMLSLRIATTRDWEREVDGEVKKGSRTTWHTVRCFGDYALKKAKAYKKGDLLYAFGEHETHQSTGQDGTVYENSYIKPSQLRKIPRSTAPELTPPSEEEVKADAKAQAEEEEALASSVETPVAETSDESLAAEALSEDVPMAEVG